MFINRKHKESSNIKRSNTLKEIYRSKKIPNGMGWPKYDTAEEKRRGKLNSQIKSRYGITLIDFEKMKLRQKKKCEICKRTVRLVIDHDHETNKIRDLLCHSCNFMLGSIKENIDALKNAIKYLKKHKNVK